MERFDAREEHSHGRVEGDGQERGDRHGQVLGVGQGPEEAPLLVDQGEDRHEGDGDDQEREEDRRTDLEQRLEAAPVEVALRSARLPG